MRAGYLWLSDCHCHTLYSFAHDHCFDIPQSTTQCHKYSFFPRTATQWNKLPPDIIQSPTPDAFRARLGNLPPPNQILDDSIALYIHAPCTTDASRVFSQRKFQVLKLKKLKCKHYKWDTPVWNINSAVTDCSSAKYKRNMMTTHCFMFTWPSVKSFILLK